MPDKEISFKVSGMSCASCVAKIEGALRSVDGVQQAEVNFATEKASVRFDPNQAQISQLARAVEDAGYELAKEKVTFGVQGMTCASCVNHIEEALRGLNGVFQANVNFATEKATVEYLPGVVDLAAMRQAVVDAGYEALAPESGAVDKEKAAHEAKVRELKIKIVFGALISVPVFFGSYPSLFPWVPEIFQNFIVLWVLTTPVQFWVGWQFYRGIWAALKHKSSDMNTLIAVGTSAAYLYSIGLILFPAFFEAKGVAREVYFDTSTIIITLILLGRYLEAVARGRTSEAIKKLIGLNLIADGSDVPQITHWGYELLESHEIRIRPPTSIPPMSVLNITLKQS